MHTNTTPQEVIFFAVIHMRSLSDVIEKRTRGLIKHQRILSDNLSTFHPINPYEERIFETKLKLYKEIQAELKENGFKEFVCKVQIPIIKKKETTYTPRRAKQKYHHKQIEVKQRKEITTEELLTENCRLVQRLIAFDPDNLREAVLDLEKYKHIQNALASRGRDYFSYYHFCCHSQNKSKVILLLGGKCQDCGTKHNLTIHHVKPKSEGGKNDIGNIEILCRGCHDRVPGLRLRMGFL